MAAESVTSLKEGMEISEEELIACGCQLIKSSSLSSKIFERGSQFILWDLKTKKIWYVLYK